MGKAEDYRNNAKDCRALARTLPHPQRDQLLDMAREWEALADAAERQASPEPPET